MSDKMSPKELKSIFEKYAAREGDPNQLSKEELMLLVQNEFPSLLKVSDNCGADLALTLGREGRGDERSREEAEVHDTGQRSIWDRSHSSRGTGIT